MAMTDNMYRYETAGQAITKAAAPTPAATAATPQATAGTGTTAQALTGLGNLADIYNDPTILAFLRSSGLAEQVAANDVARRQVNINQALGMNTADLGARGQIERRNIAGGQEARGMFRSGQTLQRTAEQEAQQARMQGAMQHQAASQVGDLQGNLANQIAQNQMKAQELGTNVYLQRSLAAGQDSIDSEYDTED